MNSNRRVFLFIIYSVGLFLLISLAGYFFGFNWMPFKRVNLISDLVRSPKDSIQLAADTTGASVPPLVIEAKPHEDFTLYHKAHLITDFNADTTQPSLQSFVKKLHDLKSGK